MVMAGRRFMILLTSAHCSFTGKMLILQQNIWNGFLEELQVWFNLHLKTMSNVLTGKILFSLSRKTINIGTIIKFCFGTNFCSFFPLALGSVIFHPVMALFRCQCCKTPSRQLSETKGIYRHCHADYLTVMFGYRIIASLNIWKIKLVLSGSSVLFFPLIWLASLFCIPK